MLQLFFPGLKYLTVLIFMFFISYFIKQPILKKKYITKSNFNRLPEILALEILKNIQYRPHVYVALTRFSAEFFTDLKRSAGI